MKKELIAHRNPKSPNSEIFRTLRTNIQFMNTNKKLKTLLVTSTFPGEGKSWVTSNLAVTFAQAGKRVVLIDADMRKGRQYAIFGISPRPGLSNFLSDTEVYETGKGSRDVRDYIQPTEVENLFVIPAGNVPPNPSELLVSSQMLYALDSLKKLFDLIIIDGTPCELVADSIILSRIADSTIIVSAHKVTKKDALERVVKNIQNVGGKLAGIVLNKVPVGKGYGSKYYYYGKDASKKSSRSRNLRNRVQSRSSTREINSSERIRSNGNKFDFDLDNSDSSTDYSNNNEKNNIMENINKESIKNRSEEFSVKPDNKLNNNRHNVEEKENDSFSEKTNDIIKQINEYLDQEKNILDNKKE